MTRFTLALCTLALAACLSSGSQPIGKITGASTAKVGEVVQLDGTASTDKNANGPTYTWRFISVPTGSSPGFSDAHAPAPTFVPDVEGKFVIGLVVTDGAASNSVSLTITASGSCFTIKATVTANQGEKAEIVQVDSSCTSVQAQFNWELLSKPSGSVATVNTNDVDPNLVPDVSGPYELAYSAKYGDGDFHAAQTVAVTASSCAPTITTMTPVLSSGLFAFVTVAPACAHQLAQVTWALQSDVSLGNLITTQLPVQNDTGNGNVTEPTIGIQANGGYFGQVTVAAQVVDDHGLHQTLSQVLTFVPSLSSSPPLGPLISFALNGSTPAVAYIDSNERVVVYAELQSDNTWSRTYVTPLGLATEGTAVLAPTAVSLAVESDGTPCIAYVSGETAPALYLLCRAAGGAWPTPASGSTTLLGKIATGTPVPVAGTLSLLAGPTKLQLLYSDGTATTGGVRYLSDCTGCNTNSCTPASSCSATTATVGSGATLSIVGKMVLTSSGAARIAYWNLGATVPTIYLSTCTTESEGCTTQSATGVAVTTTNGDIGASTNMDFSIVPSAAAGIVTEVAYIDSAGYPRLRECTGANTCSVTTAAAFIENDEIVSSINLFDINGTLTALYTGNERGELIQATQQGAQWAQTFSTNYTGGQLQFVPTSSGGYTGLIGGNFIEYTP